MNRLMRIGFAVGYGALVLSTWDPLIPMWIRFSWLSIALLLLGLAIALRRERPVAERPDDLEASNPLKSMKSALMGAEPGQVSLAPTAETGALSEPARVGAVSMERSRR